MKKNGLFKKMALLVMMICAMFLMTSAAFADEASQAVIDAKNAVVNLNFSAVYDGQEYQLKSGTGFFINSEYIITCHHVISYDNVTEGAIRDALGENAEKAMRKKENQKIKVVIMRDFQVEASYINGSAEYDFAILRLKEPVNDKVPLPLADSEAAQDTQSVFALGFPAAIADFQQINVFDADDINISAGNISKKITENKVDYILNSAVVSNGNSGGPLVNSKGEVLGVVNGGLPQNNGDNMYFAIAINQIVKALDISGIEYQRVGLDSVTQQPTEAVSEEANAEVPTMAPEPTTMSEMPTIAEEKGANTGLIIGIVVGVIVLIIIVVLIIVLVTSGGKGKNVMAPPSNYPGPATAPTPAPTPSPTSGYNTASAGFTPSSNEGAGETTVLNEGAGETTVLGGQASATLLRIKTGEKITINRPEFTIGKERRKVDYCITGNNSVSRCHTKIITRGGQHFIIDMNSTNCTYLNETKLSPNVENPLNSGDKIKVSDEEFEFRTV